jgi:hypothetical protein
MTRARAQGTHYVGDDLADRNGVTAVTGFICFDQYVAAATLYAGSVTAPDSRCALLGKSLFLIQTC